MQSYFRTYYSRVVARLTRITPTNGLSNSIKLKKKHSSVSLARKKLLSVGRRSYLPIRSTWTAVKFTSNRPSKYWIYICCTVWPCPLQLLQQQEGDSSCCTRPVNSHANQRCAGLQTFRPPSDTNFGNRSASTTFHVLKQNCSTRLFLSLSLFFHQHACFYVTLIFVRCPCNS